MTVLDGRQLGMIEDDFKNIKTGKRADTHDTMSIEITNERMGSIETVSTGILDTTIVFEGSKEGMNVIKESTQIDRTIKLI